MIAVVQRVINAKVEIGGLLYSSIGKGLLVLLGISTEDDENDCNYIAKKIVQMRLFNDSKDVMNLNLQEINGEILIVSQFTLLANTKKGNRPSYINAARPEKAIPLYEYSLKKFEELLEKPIQSGKFGADMKVSLINDGPVTICLDSKIK